MHQKRLSVKEVYSLKKKIKNRFVVYTRPGPHKRDESMSLVSLFRDVLGYCENSREARQSIKSGQIMVDGKVRKDHKYPVGIFDVVTIPGIKKSFRLVPGEKWIKLVEIDDSDLKLCKIKAKKMVRGGKIQVSLHDGKNIIVKKDDYSTGDSLLVTVPEMSIKKHIKRGKDCLCLVTKGSRKGKIAKLKGIRKIQSSTPNLASIEIDQKRVDIPEDFIFVVGEKSPALKISD